MQRSGDVLGCGLDEIECSERRNESIPLLSVSCGVTNFKVADCWACEMSCLGERFDDRAYRRVCQSLENAGIGEVG